MGTTEIEGQLLEFWEERDLVPAVRIYSQGTNVLKLHGAEAAWDGELYALCDGPRSDRAVRPARMKDLPLSLCAACQRQRIENLLAAERRELLAQAKRNRKAES